MKTNVKKVLDGINLIQIPAEQYKTNLISLYIKRPLNREEVTKNALIPYILRAGSKNYESQLTISQKLQLLYGSSFSVSVRKAGEMQILTFKIAFTNDKYLDEDIQGDVFDLFLDIIFNPNIKNNSFNEKKLSIEKTALKEALLSKINNKALYAMDKMNEHMFEGEPFSMPEDGFAEDLDSINGKNLYEHYKDLMANSEIDILTTGYVDVNLLENKVKAIFEERKDILEIKTNFAKKDIKKVKEIKENLDVNQGKIVIGYRTNIGLYDNLSVPLAVYNTVLGGSASSKLFRNVREKHSLAYSISSSIDKFVGALFINAGIEISDFEKAKYLIFEQVDAMSKADISDDEIEKAKKQMINSIKSVRDSVQFVADYFYSLRLQGDLYTPESMIERIKTVTVDEIVEVSKRLQLDTIYFLTNEEGNND